MGCFWVIYGRIEGARDASRHLDSPHLGALAEHNQRAVESIPDTDDQYPFLTRHMFSLARPRLGLHFDRGIIHQIVHFGASLKVDVADTGFADAWLRKFEAHLLAQLAWTSAVVHFEHEELGDRIARYWIKPCSLRAIRDELAETGRWSVAKVRWQSDQGAFAKNDCKAISGCPTAAKENL